jgi:hypothetical protein
MRCEYCGDEFVGVRLHQRFCTIACGQQYFAWERREAVKAFRAAAQTSTYHSRQEEALAPGGRFAAEAPRVDWKGQPPATWSEDPSGIEPPVDGRGEGSILGYRIHGDGHDPA